MARHTQTQHEFDLESDEIIKVRTPLRGCSHIVWVDVCRCFAKVLPFTRVIYVNVVTLYQSRNAQLFLISIFCYYNFCPLSDPVKRDLF